MLDDYTPLRTIDDDLLSQPFTLFPIRPAKLFVPDRVIGGPKGSQGDSYYTASNPPFGAVFTYYLKESFKTRLERRHEQEKKTKQEGGDNPYPGWDALKQEQREESPQLVFTIRTPQGQVVRRVTGPVTAGTHRVAWDLCYGSFTGDDGPGPLVAPGTYTVQAAQRVDGQTTTLGEPQSFQVVSIVQPTLPPQDAAGVLAFQQQAGRLQRQVVGAARRLETALAELDRIQQVVANSADLSPRLHDQAQAVRSKLLDLQEQVRGDTLKEQRSQVSQVSLLSRIQHALQGTMRQTYGPTETHRQQLQIARRQYQQVSAELKKVFDEDYQTLLDALDKAGAPWTPGRS